MYEVRQNGYMVGDRAYRLKQPKKVKGPKRVGGSERKGLKGERLVVTWVCSVIFIRYCLLKRKEEEERRGRGKKEREGRYGSCAVAVVTMMVG